MAETDKVSPPIPLSTPSPIDGKSPVRTWRKAILGRIVIWGGILAALYFLVWPFAWFQVCLKSNRTYWDVSYDKSGEVVSIEMMPGLDWMKAADWRRAMSQHSRSRLIKLVRSDDALDAWVGVQALYDYVVVGELSGFLVQRSSRPVPLDIDCARAFFYALGQDPSYSTEILIGDVLLQVPLGNEFQSLFVEAMKDANQRVALAGMTRLRLTGLATDPAISTVGEIWENKNVVVRRGLLRKIIDPGVRFKLLALPYQEILLEALQDEDLRWDALIALQGIDVSDPDSMELVRKLIEDSTQTQFPSIVRNIRADGLTPEIAELLFSQEDKMDDTVLTVLLGQTGFSLERRWELLERELLDPRLTNGESMALRVFGGPPIFRPAQAPRGGGVAYGGFTVSLNGSNTADSGMGRNGGGTEDVGPRLPSDLLAMAQERKNGLTEKFVVMLTNEDSDRAKLAVSSLVRLAPENPDLISPALKGGDVVVIKHALAWFLRRLSRRSPQYWITPSDEQVVVLLDLLEHPNKDCRGAAGDILLTQVNRLEGPALDRIVETARKVGTAGANGSYLDIIRKARPDDLAVIELAVLELPSGIGIRHLLSIGERAEAAVPFMLKGVREGTLRDEVVEVFVTISYRIDNPEDASMVLQTMLNPRASSGYDPVSSGKHRVRLRQLMSLCPNEVSLKTLLSGIKANQVMVRENSAKLLAATFEVGEVLDFFFEGLQGSDEDLHRGIVLAIKEYGPPAYPFAKSLLPLLKSDDVKLRVGAIAALGRIGEAAGPLAAAALARVLKEDKYVGARVESLKSLGRYGALATPYRQQIDTMKQDPERVIELFAEQTAKILDGAELQSVKDAVTE